MKYLLLILISTQLTSCASYLKRKQCEQVNWFEYGEQVALKGQWLNADNFTNECRKAEAEVSESQLDQGFKRGRQKYCSPEQARITGRKGESFSRDLCEGPGLNQAITQYQDGIKQYCARSNGFHAGQSGVVYKNVCPENLEPAFLVEYKKGRSSYLKHLISADESEMKSLQQSLPHLSTSVASLRAQESSLQAQLTNTRSLVSMAQNSNPALKGTLKAQAEGLEQNLRNVRHQRQTAESEKSQADQKISNLESNLKRLRQELAQLEAL